MMKPQTVLLSAILLSALACKSPEKVEPIEAPAKTKPKFRGDKLPLGYDMETSSTLCGDFGDVSMLKVGESAYVYPTAPVVMPDRTAYILQNHCTYRRDYTTNTATTFLRVERTNLGLIAYLSECEKCDRFQREYKVNERFLRIVEFR